MRIGILLSSLPKVARHIRGKAVGFAIRLSGGHCGSGLRIERGFRLRHGVHSGIRLGHNVYLGKDTTIDCPESGRLEIGSNVTLTQGVFVSAAAQVKIGDGVLIGEYVSLRDANHAFDDLSLDIRLQPMIPKPIEIQRNCWIGRGACILAGVVLAEGTVIGANSVVNSNSTKDAIKVGVPARHIRNRGTERT